MRIGVALFQYFAGRVGGTGEMIEQGLPRLLAMLQPTDCLVLFGSPENLNPLRGRLDGGQVEFVEIPIRKRKLTLLRLGDLLLPGKLTGGMVRRVNEMRPDVVWYPQQSMFPMGVRARSVVTCVDLQHQHLRENFSLGERWGRSLKDRQMVLRADRILCISGATRDDLLACHGGDPQKVGVLYLGGGGELVSDMTAVERENGGYLYYPANAYPHKNHVRLIRAFREFRQLHPEEPIRLVMTGQISPAVQQELSSVRREEGVEHLGFVSTERKEELFRGCRAVVFPSLFEGFGIPIIEGLQQGKRVLCHRLPVFEELVGDEVVYCDARSEEGLRGGLERLLRSEDLPPIDAERRREILARLTWEEFARGLLRELRGA